MLLVFVAAAAARWFEELSLVTYLMMEGRMFKISFNFFSPTELSSQKFQRNWEHLKETKKIQASE